LLAKLERSKKLCVMDDITEEEYLQIRGDKE
jgi:hypothetical protein